MIMYNFAYGCMNLDDIRDEVVLYYFNKMTEYVENFIQENARTGM